MRLIDADAIKFYYGGLAHIPYDDFMGIANYFMNQIKEMPTVTPEHIKGKWLPPKHAMPGKEYKFHVCSVCGVCDEYVVDVPRPNGTIARIESVRNFCPNCGADMRGEQDE